MVSQPVISPFAAFPAWRLNAGLSPHDPNRRWLHQGEYRSKSGAPVEILPSLVTIKRPDPGLEQPQLVVLYHYAMQVWDRSHYGSCSVLWHAELMV